MKLGILTFAGGRFFLDEATRERCSRSEGRIADWLRGQGHIVVAADAVVDSGVAAAREAERLANADCDGVFFHYSVWSGPELTAQAALLVGCPILLVFGGSDPSESGGFSAFLAAAGVLREAGIAFGRAPGDVDDAAAQQQIGRWIHEHARAERQRGEDAAQKLYGARYGRFEGSGAVEMDAGAATMDASQWLSQFGIVVRRHGPASLRQRAQEIAPERIKAGLDWLERQCRDVRYDHAVLTPGADGTLAWQVRMYLAIKDRCAEEQIAFCGLPDLLDGPAGGVPPCATAVPAALLSEAADWEGVKSPIVCAGHGDANGALTMQLLHLLCGTPVLFASLRRYHAGHGLFYLTEAGVPAPYLAARADEPALNWREVTLFPQGNVATGGGGAFLDFLAGPAPEVTFARITRRSGRFVCHLLAGEFAGPPQEESAGLSSAADLRGPRVWARFPCTFAQIVDAWPCSRIHAAVGDHGGALQAACEALDIEVIRLD